MNDESRQQPGRRPWRLVRVLVAPVLILVLLGAVLVATFTGWLESGERYDDAALREWLDESRNADRTLAERVRSYLGQLRRYAELKETLAKARHEPGAPGGFGGHEGRLELRYQEASALLGQKHNEIHQHLRAMAEPITKMYPGQLPLFPVIYALEVTFDLDGVVPDDERRLGDMPLDAIGWDSGLDPGPDQSREKVFPLTDKAKVRVQYQLHAWKKRQRDEQARIRRLRQLLLLVVAVVILGVGWLVVLQAERRERELQERMVREQIANAERELLEQRLATQSAEQKALELRSNLYRDRSVMAGSYAHNIRNLLVRPNDLLQRCREEEDVEPQQRQMIDEVMRTLETVDDWLKRLLETVRRDPARAERKAIDLNAVLFDLKKTWSDVASDRWRLDLVLDLTDGPTWVDADAAHLQQAVENLLFNARDATFEMRNRRREQARTTGAADRKARQQAHLEAANWRGRVVLRSRREEIPRPSVVLEVSDNGIGMSEEVQKHCTESHYTTKRNNALYEGMHTGMGLGLSFVAAIAQHHDATLEIESAPMQGATFRIRFPAAQPAKEEKEDKQ